MAMTNFNLFGSLIVEKLQSISKNQSWLARQCNVTRAAVSNWVTGYRKPKLSNLYLISKLLNIPLQDLIEQLSHKSGVI